MNKKGSVIIFGMMIGLLIILLALYLAPSVVEFTNTTMTSLDCSNNSIDNYLKATCTAVDLGAFYFIGALILIGGGFFLIKVIW